MKLLNTLLTLSTFTALWMTILDFMDRYMKAYGLTEAEALAYRHNPIDNLKPLARAGVLLARL